MEAACLVKRDRVAWMSEQTKHIAGQLVLGRTTPLWQLIRRISCRKRMGPRLVALKDEEGKVIPEAAAPMWERKFLEAFSGMGELRDVALQLDEGPDERAAAPFRSEVKSVVSGVERLPRSRERLSVLMRFLRSF